jgi:polyhydroxybutyrate depolymerase
MRIVKVMTPLVPVLFGLFLLPRRKSGGIILFLEGPAMNRARFLWPLLLLLGLPAQAQDTVPQSYGGRDMLVLAPTQLPPPGARALVLVLHGGLGNAGRIADNQAESGLNMNAVAARDGFIVAYLNGTPVTRFLGGKFLGWNAGGGCCGVPAGKDVDDVAYINGAIAYLSGKYGIAPGRVFGMGHSNGAMMVQRMACQTKAFAAIVAVSGPLNIRDAQCPAAAGARILAIHGADDKNVPLAGGVGPRGLSRVDFNSEDNAQRAFTRAGARYTLQVVPGADHFLNHIDEAIMKAEGVSISQKAAAYFGLGGKP